MKKELNQKIFSKKHLNLSYRALNHYEESGIYRNERINNSNWRKFSGIDLIWINLTIQLREFGMPIKKIKVLYDKIFKEGRFGNIDKANYINQSFEDEVIDAIRYKKDLYLLIFLDCSYTFHDSTSLQQWHLGIYKNDSHINIPLSGIIKDTYSKLQNQLGGYN